MFRYTVFRESKVSQRSTYPSEKHESHIVKILYKRSDSLFLGITMTKEIIEDLRRMPPVRH